VDQPEKHKTETTIPELDVSANERRVKPEGAVPKQGQAYLLAGLAIVILLAVLFSNRQARPKSPASTPTWTMPAPTENSERAIAQLQKDLTEEQRKSQLQQAQNSHGADATSPGDTPTRPTGAGVMPEPPRDPLADAERALRFKSRFASNLVITSQASGREQSATASPVRSGQSESVQQPTKAANQHPAEIALNSAEGQPYAVFEGTTIDTVLVNRLDGDFSGPVKAMVTNNLYSQNRQHVLIPEGTFVLGEVQKVSTFGQRRLAVVFHRLIMPDGYSVDLDQFHGLDSKGETGLTDQVNHHYLQIFGASIALGVIAGAAEATTNAGVTESGADVLRQGMASSLAQSGAHVLDRFLKILPEITIREGHRIKIYVTQDLLLPAYENHRMPGNIWMSPHNG
jgi:type IV secretory pathway VirB10-like protein